MTSMLSAFSWIYSRLALSVVVLFAAVQFTTSTAIAQRTWRVAKHGPADFRELQPAFDAASPGDTIHIDTRAPVGTPLAPFAPATTSKGLRVLIAPEDLNGSAVGSIRVTDLPANQCFELFRLFGGWEYEFSNCLGTIRLHACSSLPPSVIGGFATVFRMSRILDCRSVIATGSSFTSIAVERSHVVFNGGGSSGWIDPPPLGTRGWSALTMVDSDVTLINAFLLSFGVDSPTYWPPPPGIDMEGGVLRISKNTRIFEGTSTLLIGGRRQIVAGPPVRSNRGEVIYDPAATIGLQTSVPFVGNSRTTVDTSLEFVTNGRSHRGGVVADVWGAPNATAHLLISDFRTSPLPTPLGDLWLTPWSGVLNVLGTQTLDFAGTHQFVLMTGGVGIAPYGTRIGLQAVLVDSAGIRLTAPWLGTQQQ